MADHNSDTAIRIQHQGGGWVAEGPGFYVWDENPNEVVRAARELRRGNYAVRPARRMLIVEPHDRHIAVSSASAEALDF